MSNGFKFELNTQGVGELLHSAEMDACLMDHGNRIASKAGEGYEVVRMPTRNIAVSTTNRKSRKDNLKNNTLLKATGASKK